VLSFLTNATRAWALVICEKVIERLSPAIPHINIYEVTSKNSIHCNCFDHLLHIIVVKQFKFKL